MLTATAHVRRHWAVFLGLVIALAVWCALDVSRRARIDPARPHLHMTDLTVYTEAGLAFFDGREPYEVSNIRGWKYLYPPLFALLIAPLGHLPPVWQATVWFLVSALMVFGIYFECRRLVFSLAGSAREGTAFEVRPQLLVVNESKTADLDGAPPVKIGIYVAAGAAALFPALNCLQRG